MARVRRKKKAEKTADNHKIEAVKLDSAQLFTFEPTAPIWSSLKKTQIRGMLDEAPFEISGAFFRLRPPAETADEILDEFEDALRERGARQVKILPRLAEAESVTIAEEVDEDDETPIAEMLRSTVYELAGDDEDIRSACEELMTGAGL